MTHRDPNDELNGMSETPPKGVDARMAWQEARAARRLAERSSNASLEVFQALGKLVGEVSGVRDSIEEVKDAVIDLARRIDGTEHAVRDSHHDLERQANEAEQIVQLVHERTDSLRVKRLAEDGAETLIAKHELARLQKLDSDRKANSVALKIAIIAAVVGPIVTVIIERLAAHH